MRVLFLWFLGLVPSLQAGDLTIRLDPGEGQTLLDRVSVIQLFDPGESVGGAERTGPLSLVYRALPPGTYAVTRHDNAGNWASSPIFDQTVQMEDKDQTVIIKKPEVWQQLSITLPPAMAAQVDAMYADFSKVPCRVQRVEGKTLPPYGYRWLLLDRKSGNAYVGITELSKGTYTLTFPFGSNIQPWPPIRHPSNQLTQPFLAFQIQIDEKLQVSSMMEAVTISVRDAVPSDLEK